MLELAAGDYRLVLDPARGGSVARFEWRDRPLLRANCGAGILDVGCFPLVPFSNRIATGRFGFAGHDVVLAPNCPAADPVNPLHGFGWLAEWQVGACGPAQATLFHDYPGGEWPWPYRAWQTFELGGDGLLITLSLANLGPKVMPAGLGLHPYFPRDERTLYRGWHRDEWRNSADCLPLACDSRRRAIDWWGGRPVGERIVDTVYGRREGALFIAWPERGTALTIEPSANLPHTVVYVPAGADHFCVEPVSHLTDAVNRLDGDIALLAPGASLTATVRMRASTFEQGN